MTDRVSGARMRQATSARLAHAGRATLGECPVWSTETETLFWLDCRAPAMHCWSPGTGRTRAWPLREWTGSFAMRSCGGFVCATGSGFWWLEETGTLSQLVMVEAPSDVRLNDGKCDPHGRFWAGQVDSSRTGPRGRLYRLGTDLAADEASGGYTVFNGLCWSPGGATAYTADSWTRTIYAHDFDVSSGTIGSPRPLIQFDAEDGMPDGATVDIEGRLWVSMFDGACIHRITPEGELDLTIPLPVLRPTSCTFGGSDLSTLYITTARVRLTEAELREQPLAGSILAIETDTRGLPAISFDG